MKTLKTSIFVALIALLSCQSKQNSSIQKLTFGIYGTIKTKDIANVLIDTLKHDNFVIESDKELPIVGYFPNGKAADFQNEVAADTLKLVKTKYPIDDGGKYYALVVLKPNPAITNSDIRKTKNKGKNVEIHFTMAGAKKWADFIKNNKDNMVAFVINNKIYSMPYVRGVINSGKAIISGLENEEMAKEISESLNNK